MEGDIHSALRELPSEERSQPCSHRGPELGGGGKGLEEARLGEARREDRAGAERPERRNPEWGRAREGGSADEGLGK